ncbi:MAG: carbamoyl-phosphate synthase domain-containing protein, partial [Methylobacter sp.]
MTRSALLVLEDGTVFNGVAIGADGYSVGEVVFNTAMTGYQEILSDPSYARQIVTLTYPHIGNVGTNSEDDESSRVFASGLVVRDMPLLASNWRSEKTLQQYLLDNNVVAIADIDTRKLTRLLRDKGAQRGCIMAGETVDVEVAKTAIDSFPGLKGMDLAKVVSVTEPYEWTENIWHLQNGHTQA